jgi:hypothetical protein
MWGSSVRVGVAVLLKVLCGACYTAIDRSHDALQPGARVYVDLTEAGTRDLAGYVGPSVRRVLTS